MKEKDIIYALEEEMGNPWLFTGRKREIDDILNWTEGVKINSINL